MMTTKDIFRAHSMGCIVSYERKKSLKQRQKSTHVRTCQKQIRIPAGKMPNVKDIKVDMKRILLCLRSMSLIVGG